MCAATRAGIPIRIEHGEILMNQHRPTRVWHLVTLIVLTFVLAGCGTIATTSSAATPAAATTTSESTQVNEGGAVTVTATWVGAASGPIFTIAMNTHSVDLDAIDLTALATLNADGIHVRPTSWGAPAGGHHREGALSFPTTTDDGRTVIGPETKMIELVIRDVADVPERTFRWTK